MNMPCKPQIISYKLYLVCLTVLASLFLSPRIGHGDTEPIFEWKLDEQHMDKRPTDFIVKAIQGPDGILANPASFDVDGAFLFENKQNIFFPEKDARRLS